MEELRLPMDVGGVNAAPATNSPKRRCCLCSSLAGFVKHLRGMATLAVDVLALLDVGVLEAETKQTLVSNL